MKAPIPPLLWTAVALSTALCLLGAEGSPEAFDEVHFGINPGARLLAVTVAAQGNLWRLWPEEVKAEHKKGESEYVLSYVTDNSPIRQITAASADKSLTEACRQEARRLNQAPGTPVTDDKIVTTVYVPVEEGSPTRLSARALEGLRIVDVRPLDATAFSTNAKDLELESWTRAVYLKVSYQGTEKRAIGPSDIVVTGDPIKGEYQVSLQKAGKAALTQLAADGALSAECAKALLATKSASAASKPAPSGPPKLGFSLFSGLRSVSSFLNFKRLLPSTHTAIVLLSIPESAPRTLSVQTPKGVTLQELGSID